MPQPVRGIDEKRGKREYLDFVNASLISIGFFLFFFSVEIPISTFNFNLMKAMSLFIGFFFVFTGFYGFERC